MEVTLEVNNAIATCAQKAKKRYKLVIMEDLMNENANETEKKKVPLCEKREELEIKFKKCVKGYHLINTSPINETIWEDINGTINTSAGVEMYSKSDGSHTSGMDINCSLGRISNKSAKYTNNKKSIDISSYRLTTVCSEKSCGTPAEFIEEINKRKNFDYYSCIIRHEPDNKNISYDWLFIPANYVILDPASYTWTPTLGKRGKNKDTQVGWHTNEISGCKMSITFSMSSQLWIHIEMSEEIKKFIIANVTVENKPRYNYIELAEKAETEKAETEKAETEKAETEKAETGQA